MADLIQSVPHIHLFWMVLKPNSAIGIGFNEPALNKDVSVWICKAGRKFEVPSSGGKAFEIGYGWYGIDLVSVDTSVLGDLAYHHEAVGCGNSDGYKDYVIPPSAIDTQHNDNQTIISLLSQLVILNQQLVDGLTPPE